MIRTEDMKTILAEKLHEFRHKQGLSQESLAELADLNPTYVGSIERGQANPTLDTLCRLAKALHVEVADLFYSPSISLELSNNDERFKTLLWEYSRKISELYEYTKDK